MPERMFNLLGSIPFLLMTEEGGRRKVRANWARIVEILMTIIAILWFLSSRMDKVEVKIDSIEKQVQTLDARVFQHMTNGH